MIAGLIPEFIGRIPTIVSTTALTKDELIQVCFYSLYTLHQLKQNSSVSCCTVSCKHAAQRCPTAHCDCTDAANGR
jgi:hypothetical protein